ncbi:hypothetical protein E4U52_004159 [Claviceps spartinae]|nr:hypothetical protein E4U52_004159 [Claviceps spartinae]
MVQLIIEGLEPNSSSPHPISTESIPVCPEEDIPASLVPFKLGPPAVREQSRLARAGYDE